MTTQEDLLDRLDETRERLLVALEYLPDEALVASGVIGRWSIADLITVLTAWDAEVVTGLMRLKQGKDPEKLLAALANTDAYNAGRYRDAQGRDLDVIFEDFQGARLHLEEWLGEFSDRVLNDPRHYKALKGESLGRLIARATWEHEARYLPFLESFAERWEPLDEQGGELTIPLSAVDLLPIIPEGDFDNGAALWDMDGEDDDDDE